MERDGAHGRDEDQRADRPGHPAAPACLLGAASAQRLGHGHARRPPGRQGRREHHREESQGCRQREGWKTDGERRFRGDQLRAEGRRGRDQREQQAPGPDPQGDAERHARRSHQQALLRELPPHPSCAHPDGPQHRELGRARLEGRRQPAERDQEGGEQPEQCDRAQQRPTRLHHLV